MSANVHARQAKTRRTTWFFSETGTMPVST
jgi:hypothetical protein